MPPAIPAERASHTAVTGPSQAPSAASSFTSPAPIPPSRNQGRNRAQPIAQPARLHTEPAHPLITPKKTMAAADAPNVSTFGIRRDLKSVTHATAPIRITAASGREAATMLWGIGLHPEILRAGIELRVVGSEEAHTPLPDHDAHDANERAEKHVLYEVLRVL